MSHHLFDLPVMMAGALAGAWADVALVQHFHLAKAWALVGLAPAALLGGFLAFCVFHLFLDGLSAIDEHIRSKKKTP